MVQRIINIPDSYWKSLNALVRQPNESAGFLIYDKENTPNFNNLNVVYFDYNQSDNSVFVQPDLEKWRRLNDLVSGQSTFGFIDFHTHTDETIRGYGEYYGNNISETDVGFITEILAKNSEYIHLVFTPFDVLKFSEETVMCERDIPIRVYQPNVGITLENLTDRYMDLEKYFNG